MWSCSGCRHCPRTGCVKNASHLTLKHVWAHRMLVGVCVLYCQFVVELGLEMPCTYQFWFLLLCWGWEGGGDSSGVSHGLWLFHHCLIEGRVQGMSWLTQREIVESWDRDWQWAWIITEDGFDDIWSSQTNKIVMDFLLRFFSCKASYCHYGFCLICLFFVFLHLELWNFV